MKIFYHLPKDSFLITLQLLKIHLLIFKLFVFNLFTSWIIKIFH